MMNSHITSLLEGMAKGRSSITPAAWDSTATFA
jgi:hypothetical protein